MIKKQLELYDNGELVGVFSSAQIAEITGIKQRTVYYYIKTGKLMDGRWYIDEVKTQSWKENFAERWESMRELFGMGGNKDEKK